MAKCVRSGRRWGIAAAAGGCAQRMTIIRILQSLTPSQLLAGFISYCCISLIESSLLAYRCFPSVYTNPQLSSRSPMKNWTPELPVAYLKWKEQKKNNNKEEGGGLECRYVASDGFGIFLLLNCLRGKKIISGSCGEQHRGGFKSTMKVFYTALRAHTNWRQIAKWQLLKAC